MADLFGKLSRTERQEQGVQRWVDNKLCGTLNWATGVGKTRGGMIGISRFLKKNPTKTVIIVDQIEPKQKQWIRLSNNIELLDTPGVLWPRLEKEEIALNLAYTGTIKSEILDEVEIAYNLLKYLLEEYRQAVVDRYSLNSEVVEKILSTDQLAENERIVEVMNYIGEKRGAVAKGNTIDLNKVSKIILDDFRSGNLGRITLEKVER